LELQGLARSGRERPPRFGVPAVGLADRTERRRIVGDVVFIVSHYWADEKRDVILDRRTGERRRSLGPPPIERRRMERRRDRDIAQELQSSGWALVRRS